MLKHLAEAHGHFLTRDQIKENFYPIMSKGGFGKRIAKYVNEDILEKNFTPFQGKCAYSLTRKALNVLVANQEKLKKLLNEDFFWKFGSSGGVKLKYFNADYFYRKNKVNFKLFQHSHRLNEIRFLLQNYCENNQIHDYFTEKMVRRYLISHKSKIKNKRPDSVLISKYSKMRENDSKVIAFEYEHTAKKKHRYVEIFKQYKKEIENNNFIDYVLYITRDEFLKKRILKYLSQRNSQLLEHLFVITYEDFKHHTQNNINIRAENYKKYVTDKNKTERVAKFDSKFRAQIKKTKYKNYFRNN